jgi:hypothetical protein
MLNANPELSHLLRKLRPTMKYNPPRPMFTPVASTAIAQCENEYDQLGPYE